MNVKRLTMPLALTAALLGLYGCSGGDKAEINITENTTINNPPPSGGGGTTPPPGPGTPTCPDWTTATTATDGTPGCALPTEILVNRTLTSDIQWILEGATTVGNGNRLMSVDEGRLQDGTAVVNATLSIQPGTQIRGRTGTFANLTITRGSRIIADGTREAPIRFSSDSAGFDGLGLWGGLILHGYAPHNECLRADQGAVPCNVDSEGESGFAGGYSPNDSTGVLRYVSVAEGGFEFAPGNEINGISLIGVGAGTVMEYIEVYGNLDDGIEYYGGTVDTKYLLLVNILDDALDWDEGWIGNVQFVLAIQGEQADGNAIEADTLGTDDFLSKPTIANATFIQNGANRTALVFKELSGGFLHHSVVTAASTLRGSPSRCVDAGRAARVGVELVFTNVICDMQEPGNTVLIPATIPDVQLDANFASQATEARSVGPLNIININATYAESVADPTFFDVTDYAGAIDPRGGRPWYEGWSIFSEQGNR